MNCQLAIIGGGPAGMAAAISAYDNGIEDIIIIERDSRLGGILPQCIHSGFGLHKLGKELTGPEYSLDFEKKINERHIPVLFETMVTNIDTDHTITVRNKQNGIFFINATAIILATGSRERSRGSLNIPGERLSGIFTAGTAQKMMNLEGEKIGDKIVVLGSGDIGLMMARRLTLCGAEVKAVCEIMPYSSGLKRNLAQCIDDFNIPLLFCHTVTKIHGDRRLNAVTVTKVDENQNPIPDTEMIIECDTLLLSCGLIPENEIIKNMGIEMDSRTGGAVVDTYCQTSVKGIFSCGNALMVHDLVDFVTNEGEIAGEGAAKYIKNNGELKGHKFEPVIIQKKNYSGTDNGKITCVICPKGCQISAKLENDGSVDVEGSICPRGVDYAVQEMTCPMRVFTASLPVENRKNIAIPVKSNGYVPRNELLNIMKKLYSVPVSAPINEGDVIFRNAFNGVDIIATRTVE